MMKFRYLLLTLFSVVVIALLSSCGTCEHEYLTAGFDGECDKTLTYTQECVKCGEEKEFTLYATGHTFNKNVIPPTCTDVGYTEYTCHCGYSYKDDYVSAKGHDNKFTVTSPTCTEIGFTRYECQICRVTYKDNYKSHLGHEMVGENVSADCTEQGYVKYSCKNCDYTYNGDYCEPKGHSLKIKLVAPDCINSGYTEYTCENCKYSYKSDFLKPNGHDFSVEVISAVSCTQQGERVFSCACGESYSEITPPKGHDFETSIVSPTVSDMGYTEYSCDCGFEYRGNYRFYSEILDNAYAGNDQVVARGIDLSKWNHKVNSNGEYEPIDWVALKESGVDFVILKIGSSIRDNGNLGGIEPTFEADYAGAKAAGLDVGVYFFTYATTVSEIKKDAEVLLTYLEGKQFEYPIYLDIEDEPNEGYYPSRIASPILTEMCLEFFSALQRKGYYTGLYVNNEFLFNVLQTENIIELFEVWYARYPSYDTVEWNRENIDDPIWNTEKYGDHLGMWQYTMRGIHESITGDVDFNFAYKNYPDIITHNHFNGY